MKKLPKDSVLSEPGVRLSDVESKALGIPSKSNKNTEFPYIALKYYDSRWQCFSDWQADELKAFSSFSEKLGVAGEKGIGTPSKREWSESRSYSTPVSTSPR